MKKRNLKTFGLVIISIITLSFLVVVSCKKDESTSQKDTSMSVVQDDNYASDTYQDVSDITDEAASKSNQKSTSSSEYAVLSDCAVVTIDSSTSIREMTVDFGSEGCTGVDGKVRKGKIIVAYSGDYWADGVVKTVSFDNYYVNDHKVTGTKIVTAGVKNDSGNRFYSESVSGTIEWANGDSAITWNAQHTRVIIDGSSTWRVSDDIYQLTGSTSGVDSEGEEYSSTITSPLVRKVEPGCRYNYVQGIIEIAPIGKSKRVVDYGDGTCDRWAIVTVDGDTYHVYLR